MIAVVDLIGDLVNKTSERVKKKLGFDVFYQYGHIREISETLNSYSKTEKFRTQKYPAIFLLQDFAEIKGLDTGVLIKVNLQLLIVADSNKSYRSAERYEKVFKPILYPIYQNFLTITEADSRLLVSYDGISHEKIDRLLISNALVETTKGTANLFNDYLDAIELRNFSLSIIGEC